MRLNRFLSQAGVASRRKSDDLIQVGKVAVNGVVTTNFSTDVSNADLITVNGKTIQAPRAYSYIVMNKPAGLVTTTADFHTKEKNVMELVPRHLSKLLKPVGRLDKDSTGLLLLTDDGDLAHELTHPSFEHEKEYVVACSSGISDDALEQLRTGVGLEEGTTTPAQVTRINAKQFRIVLKQGWERQVRRMVGAVGGNVEALERIRVGKLTLHDLQIVPGEIKNIRREDIV